MDETRFSAMPPARIPGAREAALAALPRIGAKQITSRAELIRRTEDLALELGDIVAAREAAGDPNWWQTQDLLDDMLDLLDFAREGALP